MTLGQPVVANHFLPLQLGLTGTHAPEAQQIERYSSRQLPSLLWERRERRRRGGKSKREEELTRRQRTSFLSSVGERVERFGVDGAKRSWCEGV